MITTGFWCDECRLKYVRHRCKHRTLPCGHDYWNSVVVYAQAFGRGGEHVEMEWGERGKTSEADLWVWVDREVRRNCIGHGAVEFWATRIHNYRGDPDVQWWAGEWLASKPDRVIRAFLNRWQSSQYVPDWIAFKSHPYAVRARALERISGGGPSLIEVLTALPAPEGRL